MVNLLKLLSIEKLNLCIKLSILINMKAFCENNNQKERNKCSYLFPSELIK